MFEKETSTVFSPDINVDVLGLICAWITVNALGFAGIQFGSDPQQARSESRDYDILLFTVPRFEQVTLRWDYDIRIVR